MERAERAGIYLPPVKVLFFDAIKRAGDVGVATRELADWPGRRPLKLSTVKAHLWQLQNLYLDGTDRELVCEGRGPNARWYLRRRVKRARS